MNTFMFLFRELLGAIRAKSAAYFALAGLLLFLFLAVVSSFFLLTPVEGTSPEAEEPIEEIHAFLSATLSSATIDARYLEFRERPEVADIQFRFAQELDPSATGGVFVIVPVSNEAAAILISELELQSGVTEVVEVAQEVTAEEAEFSLVVRIGLLCGLVFTIAGSFVLVRLGYRELLGVFSGEVRMLRLSGIAARSISVLIVCFGLLIGILAGVLHFVVIYLVHQIVVSQTDPWRILEAAAGGWRTVGLGLIGLALGSILGGLMGLLGASLLHARKFDPLP